MAKSFDTALLISAVTSSELERQIAELKARRIHVFVADETNYDKLKRKYTSSEHIHVHHQFVTAQGGHQPYFKYNLGEFSGAAEATKLKELFPNLRLMASEKQESKTVTEILDDIKVKGLFNNQDSNYMLLNIPGSGQVVLNTLSEKQLKCFARIEVATTAITLFVGGEQASNIQTQFIGNGFKEDSPLFNSDDQDFPIVAVTQDIEADLQQRIQNLQKKLSVEKQTSTNLQTELDQLRQIRDTEIEEFQVRHKATQEENASNLLGSIELLENKVTYLQKVLIKKIEVLEFSLNKRLSVTAKQVESFISLNDYLTLNRQPLSFHGWPISPDLGLLICALMKEERYDIVVEFGSGTSTVLFAKMIEKLSLNAKVISFEHDLKYYKSTENGLLGHNVNQFVDLTYTPLVSLEGEEEKVYYDCIPIFKKLEKKLKGKKKKIAVFVDGPPGNVCKNARYPALILLIDHLATHEIHFIVDDYERDEEKCMVNSWIDILKSRELKYELQINPLDKGCAIIRVN